MFQTFRAQRKIFSLCFFFFCIFSSFSNQNPWQGKGYKGDVLVEFKPQELENNCYAQEVLQVVITTDRLIMRSTIAEDAKEIYQKIYNDPVVMEKYAFGKHYPFARIQRRVERWAKRWEENIPFSAFSILKKETCELIGIVINGYGEKEGNSQMAFLLASKEWGKGYGTEMVIAVLCHYTVKVIERGDLVPSGDNHILYPYLGTEITTRVDNPASWKILERLGVPLMKIEEKYGGRERHLRRHYYMPNCLLTEGYGTQKR